jgi:hypothetical protein
MGTSEPDMRDFHAECVKILAPSPILAQSPRGLAKKRAGTRYARGYSTRLAAVYGRVVSI